MVFFLLVFINVSLIIRFKRIDRSTSELDLKGYTKESNLIGGAFGIVFTLVVFIIAILEGVRNGTSTIAWTHCFD